MRKIWKDLLAWYGEEGRDLPWRLPAGEQAESGYQTVVSEFMLQQTQVSRVIPLYEAFLKRFPNWEKLARARQSSVVKAWQGLGYNMRALRLQALAVQVVTEYNGRLPGDLDALLGLKGVGPYTARALQAFVFRKPVLAPDTNVRRVLTRYFVGPKEDPRIFDEQTWSAWERTVPKKEGYDVNQALMDLGSQVCTARGPVCGVCPLKALCNSWPAITTLERSELPRQKETSRERVDRFGIPNRIYRGRIVERLRGDKVPVRDLTKLGKRVREEFSRDDIAWLQNVLSGLVKDGLVEEKNGVIQLKT